MDETTAVLVIIVTAALAVLAFLMLIDWQGRR
jgi:hypothetical protein